MNTETVEINTVEELTIHALDHTDEGIESLAEDTRRCGRALTEQDPSAFQLLSELATNLREFDVFEHQLCDLFGIDRDAIKTPEGTLRDNKDEFKLQLSMLLEKLENADLNGLARILNEDLSKTLTRFKSFIPLLRNHIQNEYVNFKG